MDTRVSDLAALRLRRPPPAAVRADGAGVSTDSGIPDYRDTEGEWKRKPPMTLQMFMGGDLAARALLGAQHDRLAPLRPRPAE